MFAHFTCGAAPSRRLALVLSMAALTLAACGGGGDDVVVPDEEYVSWSSSANTVRVLDWNNEAFAVRRDNGQVARYSDDLLLTGLMVIGTTVYYNSAPIGSVTYATAVSGARITDFTCTNGRELDITVTGSGNGAVWTWRCV